YNESELLTIQGPMPLLRQFEVRLQVYHPRPSAIRFCEVPRLRSVTLWNIARPIDLFPWSQLTSLTLIHRPIVNTEILQLAVNLVHCHLILWSDDIPPSDVRLPSLESLVLARIFPRHSFGRAPSIYFVDSFRNLGVVYKGSALLGKFAPRPCIATHFHLPFRSFHSTGL
ncbi:hypothetical protein B0H14DRAFT_2699602, partial [Mycena olivaceomarginata]